MRKLLNCWIKGPLSVRLSSSSVKSISESLINIRRFIPREFARKSRPLAELDRWKATEFRLFLLYTGPVILKHHLAINLYENFMLLFTACTVLLSPRLCTPQLCDYAGSLLAVFTKDAESLYGQQFSVYNVHNMVHLADDAKKFGCLDNVSAFQFENKLKDIKKLIRKPDQVLQQIVRRLDEGCGLVCSCLSKLQDNFSLLNEHCRFSLPDTYCGATQYAMLKCPSYILSLDDGNNCVASSDCKIFIVRNILSVNEEVILLCSEFTTMSSFFTYPVDSQNVGIFQAHRRHKETVALRLSSVAQKCVCLPVGNNDADDYVILPLAHI
jgi:hypothetical protein